MKKRNKYAKELEEQKYAPRIVSTQPRRLKKPNPRNIEEIIDEEI